MHPSLPFPGMIAVMALASLLVGACEPRRAGHALEGGWLADDGTVFVFRPDGTFHGYDFRKHEIWGNRAWRSFQADRRLEIFADRPFRST